MGGRAPAEAAGRGEAPGLTPEQQAAVQRQQQIMMMARMRAAAQQAVQQPQQQPAPGILGVVPYSRDMDEHSFLTSLARFLQAAGGLSLRRVPEFAGRPVPLHRLLRAVVSHGGYARVTDGGRWGDVCAAMGFAPLPSGNAATASAARDQLAAQLRGLYATLLYPYEQHFLMGVPVPSIAWQHQGAAAAAAAAAQTYSSASASASTTPPVVRPKSTTGSAANSVSNSAPNGSRPKTPQTFGEMLSQMRSDTFASLADARRSMPLEAVSWDALALMAASPDGAVRSSALGQLLRMSYELSGGTAGGATGAVGGVPVALPSAEAASAVLGVLARLLEPLAERLERRMVGDSAAANGSQQCRGNGHGEHAGVHRQPHSATTLARHAEYGSLVRSGLDGSAGTLCATSAAVLDVVRQWALRPELAASVGQCGAMISVLVRLVTSVAEDPKTAEVTPDGLRGAWLALGHAASSFSAETAEEAAGALLGALSGDIRFLAGAARRAFLLLLPSAVHAASSGGGTEDAKRAIVALHAAANGAWRALPLDAALFLDAAARVLAALLAARGGDSFGVCPARATLPGGHSARPPIVALIRPLADTVTALGGGLVPPFVALVRRLLGAPDFCASSAEYARWMAMVVHNPGFGLPDGGFLEASLVALHRALLLVPSRCVRREDVVGSFSSLVRVADAARALWMYDPAPSSGCALSTKLDGANGSSGQMSPLVASPKGALPAVAQAASSQPYALFLRLLSVLVLLAPSAAPAPPSDEAIVLSWLHDVPPSASCVAVVMRPDVLEAAATILAEMRAAP